MSGMRSSRYSDGTSPLHERRERAVNKPNSQEDFRSGTPTSGPKLNANGRASRPKWVGGGSNLSQVVQRPTSLSGVSNSNSSLVRGQRKISQPTSSNDREVTNCTSKNPGGFVANSRKQTPPAVGSWVQRPQNIPRTARRSNLLPIVPCNDENPAVEKTSDKMAERCFPVNSPAALSESEKPGSAEIKSRDKNKKSDNVGGKSCPNVPKMSTLRKNKTFNGDDHGDDMRRQGRTGRGFISSRPLSPLSLENDGDGMRWQGRAGRSFISTRPPSPLSLENNANVGTSKQVRSSRLGHGKTESRVGQQPTRRLSDRKAPTLQKQNAVATWADFYDSSDDDREELLADANAVTNTAQVPNSAPFMKAESSLHFISDVDLSKSKDQVNPVSALDMPAPAPNGRGSNGFGREEIEKRSVDLTFEDLARGAKSLNAISMYQKLVTAFIHEEGNQGNGLDMEKDVESDIMCSQISPNCVDHNLAPIPDTGNSTYDHFDQLEFGLQTDTLTSDAECSENQYCSLSIDERVLMEINAIGIYPDLECGDDEVDEDISMWQEKHWEKASINKGPRDKLLSSASEAYELQEKEFGECELVKMSYKKHETASGKMAKQSASALLNQTVKQCEEFKTTGKSCFEDPLYKDTFVSGVTRLADVEKLNSYTDGDDSKLPGTQQSPTAPPNPGSEQIPFKEDLLNRLKRKELSLEEVAGTGIRFIRKGKRSKRSGRGRDVLAKNETIKKGQGTPNAKAKPKQKTTHLPAQAKQGFSVPLKSNDIAKERKWNSVEVLEDPIGLEQLPVKKRKTSHLPAQVKEGLSVPLKSKDIAKERKGNSVRVKQGFSVPPKSNDIAKKRKGKSVEVLEDPIEDLEHSLKKQKTSHLSAQVKQGLSVPLKSSDIAKKRKGNSVPVPLKSSDIAKERKGNGVEVKEGFSEPLKSSDISKERKGNIVEVLEDPIDLSGLELPGMDDLGIVGQGEDIGKWFDNEDDDGFMDGLDTPMDDLSELNMIF